MDSVKIVMYQSFAKMMNVTKIQTASVVLVGMSVVIKCHVLSLRLNRDVLSIVDSMAQVHLPQVEVLHVPIMSSVEVIISVRCVNNPMIVV